MLDIADAIRQKFDINSSLNLSLKSSSAEFGEYVDIDNDITIENKALPDWLSPISESSSIELFSTSCITTDEDEERGTSVSDISEPQRKKHKPGPPTSAGPSTGAGPPTSASPCEVTEMNSSMTKSAEP